MRNNINVWIAAILALTVNGTPTQCSAEEEKQAQEPELQFVISLVDGTRLVCQPQIKTMPVKTSYASVEIPLEKIITASFNAETKEATIKVANGDLLKGTVSLEKIKVKTLIGEITIQMNTVEELSAKSDKKEAVKKIVDTPENRNRCINNLRMLDSAKEQWALASRASDNSVVNIPAMLQYVKGASMPVCPSGGKYDVKIIGENPACSIPGHNMKIVGW